MEDFLVILIGGIPIALGVLLGVQGLKVFKFIDDKSAPKAAMILAGIITYFELAAAVNPSILPTVILVYTRYIGAMSAGLFYHYIAAPFLEKFGVGVKSEDL